MKISPFKIRAVQLDLARQKEPLPEIKNIIGFASDWGFNTLVLYLEDRIKTQSYPYPTDDESYSLRDMEQIVKEAAKRKMNVIPVVSTLGHTERFLRFPQLAKYSELRDNRKGRWGIHRHTAFCPQQEGTYEFFERYFKELCQVFSGKYFHIGQDETWDFGFCELCNKAMKEGSLGKVWANHIIRMGEILGALGKKLMMWDDMFEFLPEALGMIPEDITMCSWHYEPLVDIPHTHFGWRLYENKLAFYHKHKIPFIICPSDYSSSQSIETFTRSALPYAPQGALLTIWEKENIFVQSSLPIIAFAGKLWNNLQVVQDYENLMQKIYSAVLRINDKLLINSLILFHKMQQRLFYEVGQFVDNPTPYVQERKVALQIAHRAIRLYEKKAKNSQSATILRQNALLIEKELAFIKLHFLKAQWEKSYRDGLLNKKALLAAFNNLRGEFLDLKKKFADEWKKVRQGIVPINTDNYFDKILSDLKFLKRIFSAPKGRYVLVRMRFFLPDYYGSQQVNLMVKGERFSKEIAMGAPKPHAANHAEVPYYYRNIVMENDGKEVKSIILKTFGYGGIGLVFVEIFDGTSRYVPIEVKVLQGQVENPENILHNNTHWTFLGNKDVPKEFFNPELANEEHIIEVFFKREH